MAINKTTKFSPKVAEYYYHKSKTRDAASSAYDFTGIKELKVYSVDTVPMGNYSRSGTARYGNGYDVGDTLQTFTMTQDKAARLVIDKGDASEQMSIKKANEMLTRQLNERVFPMVDIYNFEKWSRKAGSQITDAGTALTKNTIVSAIIDANEKIDEAAAPMNGRVLWIKNSLYKLLKQNPEFVANESLGKEALAKGIVGDVDGVEVRKVPNSYLPTGVDFVITSKDAILAPLKLMDYKIHKDPPGVSGDVIELRVMHDAFVIGAKANAICVAINNSYKIVTPVITNDTTNTNVIINTTTTGVDIWYTTDGSDPRYSDTVHKGAANTVTVTYATLNNSESGTVGKTIKACAVPNSNANFFTSTVTNGVTY